MNKKHASILAILILLGAASCKRSDLRLGTHIELTTKVGTINADGHFEPLEPRVESEYHAYIGTEGLIARGDSGVLCFQSAFRTWKHESGGLWNTLHFDTSGIVRNTVAYRYVPGEWIHFSEPQTSLQIALPMQHFIVSQIFVDTLVDRGSVNIGIRAELVSINPNFGKVYREADSSISVTQDVRPIQNEYGEGQETITTMRKTIHSETRVESDSLHFHGNGTFSIDLEEVHIGYSDTLALHDKMFYHGLDDFLEKYFWCANSCKYEKSQYEFRFEYSAPKPGNKTQQYAELDAFALRIRDFLQRHKEILEGNIQPSAKAKKTESPFTSGPFSRGFVVVTIASKRWQPQ